MELNKGLIGYDLVVFLIKGTLNTQIINMFLHLVAKGEAAREVKTQENEFVLEVRSIFCTPDGHLAATVGPILHCFTEYFKYDNRELLESGKAKLRYFAMGL